MTTLDIQGILTGLVMLGAVVSVFIEITPVKINPVSMFLEYLGSKLTAGLRTDMATLKESVEKIDNKVDNNEIDRIRWEILDFANSCRNKRKHTREEFLHVMSLNTKYHQILDARGEENGQIDIKYEFIESLYRKCLENNSFLCANGDDDC